MADNPITENVNDNRYTNSNLTEKVINYVDYAAVGIVEVTLAKSPVNKLQWMIYQG